MGNAIYKPEDEKADNETVHPFGGCDRLRRQYATIGASLLRLEKFSSFSLVQRSLSAEKLFREEVSFTPVEVLESYFDDLLDPEVPDQRLGIALRSWGQRVASNLVSLLGLLGAMVSGLYAATLGTALTLSLLIAVSLAVPFASMLYLSAGGATRRLKFAQILSREIARRRGYSDRMGVFSGATERLREFLAPQTSRPTARTLCETIH